MSRPASRRCPLSAGLRPCVRSSCRPRSRARQCSGRLAAVDVTSAPNTATRAQLGVSDQRTLRQCGDWRPKALELSLLPPRTRLHRVL
jgi:hypothetical protein